MADQENATNIGDQKFSKGFYKILYKYTMAFHLASLVLRMSDWP